MATKIRAKTTNGETEISVRIDHPMENGRRIDPRTKEQIPPHFIQKVTFSLNGKEFAVADLGSTVSRNPLIKIKLRGAKLGDKIKVNWSDNKGAVDEREIAVG